MERKGKVSGREENGREQGNRGKGGRISWMDEKKKDEGKELKIGKGEAGEGN